jgi:hypothetical protein
MHRQPDRYIFGLNMGKDRWLIALVSMLCAVFLTRILVRSRLWPGSSSTSDYPVYLVKYETWSDSGAKFQKSEWVTLQEKYSGLDWLAFREGKIFVSNPSTEQITTLVNIARHNGWLVEGWDGEIYDH